jgi:hypothetical protein
MTRLPLALLFVFALGAGAQAQQCKLGPIPDQSAGCTPGLAASTNEADVCSHAGGTYSQRHRLTQNPETKLEVMTRYGVPFAQAGKFEDDHDLPLCLGGSDSVANRWPQSRTGDWTAAEKDQLEAFACREVCAGHVPLATAQGWFLAPADWRQAYRAMAAGTLVP